MNARTITLLAMQIATRFRCPHQSVGRLGFKRQANQSTTGTGEQTVPVAEQVLDCDADLTTLQDHDVLFWDQFQKEEWETESVWYIEYLFPCNIACLLFLGPFRSRFEG
jgi:hypothetical protein